MNPQYLLPRSPRTWCDSFAIFRASFFIFFDSLTPVARFLRKTREGEYKVWTLIDTRRPLPLPGLSSPREFNWRIPWLRGSRAIYLARMRPRVSTRGETDVASRDSGCRPAPKCRLNYQHAVIYTATLDRWRAGLKTRASDTRDILYSPAVWDRTHPHQSAGRWWWTYQFSSSPRSADVPWWLMKFFQETLKIIARRLEIGKRRCDVCHCW